MLEEDQVVDDKLADEVELRSLIPRLILIVLLKIDALLLPHILEVVEQETLHSC